MATLYHVRTLHCGCHEAYLDNIPTDEATELTGSVGADGINRADDVSNVQARLNRVAPNDGGPVTQLKVDGRCGPLTNAAIKRFQLRHVGLLNDGRIDPGKGTWRKLLALSDGIHVGEFVPKASKGTPSGTTPTVNVLMPLLGLEMAKYRIYAAIRALDVARSELAALDMQAALKASPKEALFQAYKDVKDDLKELPTVDRCFHVAHKKMSHAHVSDDLLRIRKVFVTMMDVIVASIIIPATAEKSGTRRFVRIVNEATWRKIHGGNPPIADAQLSGWWKKNANKAHIRVGAQHVNDGQLVTSLIHEMAHFVAHDSSYVVNHHKKIYNDAFNEKHEQAVRNAFCYEWFAMLASFKHMRSTSNEGLRLI